MSCNQLCKTLLALVMNSTVPLTPKLAESLIGSVLSKFDKASAIDVYYLCISIGQGLGRMGDVVSTDVYYAIYLKQLQMIKDYDLYQLAQIAMVMTSPSAS